MAQGNPIRYRALLWWPPIISMAVGGSVFFLLKEQARLDPAIQTQRIAFLLAAVIITGICLIAGTSSRWFHSR